MGALGKSIRMECELLRADKKPCGLWNTPKTWIRVVVKVRINGILKGGQGL